MKKSDKKSNDIKQYTKKELDHMRSESRSDFKRLDAMSDDEIDFSDIPELSEKDWADAKLVDHGKKAISLRVDVDVLDWYKHQGGRYQKLMNMVLRKYMNSQRRRR